eukprot:g9175.t1
MNVVHSTFIDVVKEGRKNKLNMEVAMEFTKECNNEIEVSEGDGLFDGSYYEGIRAVECGLADEIASDSMEDWLQKKYGKDNDDNYIDVTIKQIKSAGFPSFLPFSTSSSSMSFDVNNDVIADQIVESLCEKVKDDMIWSKYQMMMK